jgi:hypothetical protein
VEISAEMKEAAKKLSSGNWKGMWCFKYNWLIGAYHTSILLERQKRYYLNSLIRHFPRFFAFDLLYARLCVAGMQHQVV